MQRKLSELSAKKFFFWLVWDTSKKSLASFTFESSSLIKHRYYSKRENIYDDIIDSTGAYT